MKNAIKKQVKCEDEPAPVQSCMKYNTYLVLRDFIEEQKKRVHREYCVAADHTYEWEYDGSSPPKFTRKCKVMPQEVRDFLWANYNKQMQYYNDMITQLCFAAKESNRNHPNPEMRKFWCLDK